MLYKLNEYVLHRTTVTMQHAYSICTLGNNDNDNTVTVYCDNTVTV